MTRNQMKPESLAPSSMRTAAYVRVSTDEQARSGLGIEAQKSRCLAMATVKGWPEPMIYADEGVSGTKDPMRRPGMRQLICDIEARQIDAVITLSYDRIARKTRLVLDFVDMLNKRGVVLISCKESLDTATPQGQFMLTQFAALAQLERDLIGERTAAALAERNKRDGNIGRVPYGYVRAGDGIAIDPDAAEVVRLIFKMRKRGATLRAIAAVLNTQGRTTRYSNAPWFHSSVREILLNEDAYRGGNRGASNLKWPAILSKRSARPSAA